MTGASSLTREQAQAAAQSWFEQLRDRLCAAFERLEDSASERRWPAGRFQRTPWRRPGGGGGVMAMMRGRVFEKVGVNVSTVDGELAAALRGEVPGAAESARFWASGVSVVAHMRSPHAPAAHMNTRYIVTSRDWFGGGADLTPTFAHSESGVSDAGAFHDALRRACDAYDESWYRRFSDGCDKYFYLPHRSERRGVGGVFYDNLVNNDQRQRGRHFAFTRSIGEAFLEVYPRLLASRMEQRWSDDERRRQLEKRGRYVEFNLLYDRGTRFGLLTGANPQAVLMSLPPLAAWP